MGVNFNWGVNCYKKYRGSANSSWASRNMIISGLVILAFLGLHFYDFWVPEIIYKYVDVETVVEVERRIIIDLELQKYF